MTNDDISIEDFDASIDSGVAIKWTWYDADPGSEERLTMTAELAADHADEDVTAVLEARTAEEAPWQPIRTAPPDLTARGEAVFIFDADTLAFLGTLASDVRVRTETADGLGAALDVTETFLEKARGVIRESVPDHTRPSESEDVEE